MRHGAKTKPKSDGRFRVYFAGSLGKIKIGCSSKAADRILQIGEWIPFPITMLATMPGTYALEANLHRMFADEWSHGEWFHASPRLLAFVDRVARGLPVEIVTAGYSAENDRKRAAIAEKKRIARKRHLLPPDVVLRLKRVAPGSPIPDDLLCEAKALLAGITPAEQERAA